MGKFFDIFRLMSFYFTGAGFFLTNRITTGTILGLGLGLRLGLGLEP